MYCLARDVYYKKSVTRSVILVCIYTLIHSYILLMQMLTLNSVIKSGQDTFFLFLLSNNFTEIKIYVFKKTDAFKLFEICTRDSIERVQHYTYLTYILFSNYLDEWTLSIVIIFTVTEFGVDWMKNFFFNNDNGHDPLIYLSHRYLLCKVYNDCLQKRLNKEGPDDLKLEDEEEDILKDLHTDTNMYNNMTESHKAFMDQCNKTKDI